MNVFLFILFIISLSYLIIISVFSIGWFTLSYYKKSENSPSSRVSVIIPARNEENNILNCLNDIVNQNYPADLFEVIVANDNSEDNTAKIVENFINRNNTYIVRLLNINSTEINGKKDALSNAINEAKGELIITTDADCRIGNQWISTIVDYYEAKKPKMIIGPVCYNYKPLSPPERRISGVFRGMQSLEFLSLIATTAGSAAIHMPIICNGANLAFEKKVFLEIGGYGKNSTYASGDDMFLMESIHKKYKTGVHFLKNKETIVYTEPINNFNQFLNQRMRWVSKTKGYKSAGIIFIALIVWSFNFSLLAIFLASLFHQEMFFIFICLLIAKVLIDFPILSGITGFMNRKQILKLYIPLEFINIIYVSVVGLIGNFAKFKWKNRLIKK